MKNLAPIYLSLSILILLSLSWNEEAYSCASCGSGGNTPVVLYPSESSKLYFGTSLQNDFRNIDTKGEYYKSFGPEQKSNLLFATAFRLSKRSFLATSIPMNQNTYKSESKSGLGDPMFAIHYLPILQTFAKPLIPQLQTIITYKPTFAKSIYESNEDNQLDVFGSGFSEVTLTADLWFGMLPFKAGIAQNYTANIKREFTGQSIKKGDSLRSTISIGHDHPFKGKFLTGVNRMYSAATIIDGQKQKGTEVINHGVFLTIDSKLSNTTQLTFTYQQLSRVLSNRKGFQANQVQLGFHRQI